MSVGVVQAGQLAANKAQAEHTDAKLEQQVGALETSVVGMQNGVRHKDRKTASAR